MKKIEKHYGNALRRVLKIVNPFKKMIMTTECQVHKFINIQSLRILKTYGYELEYKFFGYHLKCLNEGVVWADQDFKSINHFYNPTKKRGLFGNENSLILTERYYEKALKYWKEKKYEKSMFYLGAAIHILHDLTVPQHVNIRLLDNHRQYENFVRVTYDIVKGFQAKDKPIRLYTIRDYVEYNSRNAIKIYKKYRNIKNDRRRFYKITLSSLPLAQQTTSGAFLMFLKDINYYETIKKAR